MLLAWTAFVTRHNAHKHPIATLEFVMKANAGSGSVKTCLNVKRGRRAVGSHLGVRSLPIGVWMTVTALLGEDAFWRSASASLSVGRMMNVGPEPIAMTYADPNATAMTSVLARKFAGIGAAKTPFSARLSPALQSDRFKTR
jgi:hypothetical protein